MPMVNAFVDGNETLADNVCDNSALRVAWLAYQMWAKDHGGEEPGLSGLNFTIPQIFYVSYGQVIAISIDSLPFFLSFRVNLSLLWPDLV